jgi:hypothetical protein
MATAVLPGCAGPDTTGPEGTTTAFFRAVSQADGARACALLSAEVSTTVAESAGAPCPTAVLAAHLPAPAPVLRAEIYGHQAWVTTRTDTVFLSEFPDGWKVIGAGCQVQGDKPYDCAVSGG